MFLKIQKNFHELFFFQKKCEKLFQKNLSGNFLEIPGISKKIPTGKFSESFPENWGKLFRQTSRKETTKNSPGTFPENPGTFRQNSLWKRVFSSQISGGNPVGFLTNPGSFPENPRGNFPGNSRKFRGENSGFFSGFF